MNIRYPDHPQASRRVVATHAVPRWRQAVATAVGVLHAALDRRLAQAMTTALLGLAGGTTAAQVSTYDGGSGMLVLPSVQVGSEVYTDVRLLNLGSFTFQLQDATLQTPPGKSVTTYDAASGLLTLPAVQVGSDTYVDVTLLNLGGFKFALQTATQLPLATLSAARELLRQSDALWATAVPATGAARMSLSDACYLQDGRDRAYVIAETDADPAAIAARDAYRIGQSTVNMQVLAQRLLTAPDGAARQELDVQYDVVYRDGSTAVAVTATLVSGNSRGAAGCSAAQDSVSLRFFGNRQLVQTAARSRNLRDQRYQMSNGATSSPAVNYRREVQFVVTDPAGKATYAIVSGPGPAGSVGGVATPFSLKLLSPRVLRSAPELAGRNGNYLNWLDDDSFRYCRSSAGVPVAAIADCAGLGVGSFDWGFTAATPNATADAGFDALGFVAGGLYTFAVYNDDGWKTVNGHVGRTPIAVYTDVLEKLPYRFVDLAGSGTGADKFSRLSFSGMSASQVRANLVSAAPAPMNVSWTAIPALPDGGAFRLFENWEYFQGASATNASGVFFPAYRYLIEGYPGSTASSLKGWPVTAKPSAMASKSYNEFSLLHSDRNDRQMLSRVSFN